MLYCSARFRGPHYLGDVNLTTETPDHGQREHSAHGASIAARFFACPGSIRASQGIPNRSSPAAELGTAAHELAERCLREGCSAFDYLGFEINNHEVDDRMAAGVQLYLDTCRTYMVPGWEWWIESRVRLDLLNPPVPLFGTTDFAAYCKEDKKLVVVDYKNGYDPVSIKGNLQLRYYALGTYLSLPQDYQINEIELVVVQPNDYRNPAPKRDYTNIVDLLEFGMLLVDKCWETLKPDAPLHAGKHCKWCPKTGRCEAQLQETIEAVQSDFAAFMEPLKPTEIETLDCTKNPHVLTPEQLDIIAAKAPFIRQFLNDVEGVLKDMIERGHKAQNMEVIDTEGNRAWTKQHSADFIAGLLSGGEFGIPKPAIYTKPKLGSPAHVESAFIAEQMIKGLKKNKAKALFDELTQKAALIERPRGKKLVPKDENRKPKSLRSAADFSFTPIEGNT